mgnify:CR=1 FL=1
MDEHAVIVKTSPQSHHRASDASIDLTIVLLDGVWRRRLDVQHFWSDALQPGLDLDTRTITRTTICRPRGTRPW